MFLRHRGREATCKTYIISLSARLPSYCANGPPKLLPFPILLVTGFQKSSHTMQDHQVCIVREELVIVERMWPIPHLSMTDVEGTGANLLIFSPCYWDAEYVVHYRNPSRNGRCQLLFWCFPRNNVPSFHVMFCTMLPSHVHSFTDLKPVN